MMRRMWVVIAATAVPIAIAVQPAGALRLSGHQIGQPHPDNPVVGQLAYLTASNSVELATINTNGSSDSTQIGPVNKTPKGGSITEYQLLVSPGGGWVAWTENVTKGKGRHESFKSYVVMRRDGDGRIVKIKSSASLIGFVGQKLVVQDLNHISVVKTSGRPRLHKIAPQRGLGALFTTDPAGIVVEKGYGLHGKKEKIDLLSLTGKFTGLHTFPASMFGGQRAPLEQAWANDSGSKVMLEQGDHTDFGGVGPTSRAFVISGLHRSGAESLGTPGGTSNRVRRMQQASFEGTTPYGVWAQITRHTPKGNVYDYTGGQWQLAGKNSLVVAGNAIADIIQPAMYVSASKVAPVYDIKPTGDAVLHVGTTSEPVNLKATEMAWLNY